MKSKTPASTRRITPPKRAGSNRAERRRNVHQPNWRIRIAATGLLLGLVLVGWAAVARDFAPKENTSQQHFDALIVLGYHTDSDGNPSPTQMARVSEAVREYERGVAPRIIMTGGAEHNRFIEAETMAQIAEAQGMPADLILEDREAQNTIENACDSLRIMRNHGWQSAEVISSASQLPRAAMILGRLPLKWRVHPAPAVEPQTKFDGITRTAFEIVKTVHYLVWSRQMEPCNL